MSRKHTASFTRKKKSEIIPKLWLVLLYKGVTYRFSRLVYNKIVPFVPLLYTSNSLGDASIAIFTLSVD
jgi:hypothetical protein